MKKKLLVLFFFISFVSATAQYFDKAPYDKQYYTWPVGATKAIVANFGELRPNHYHMGLDCRTDQAENKPVLAAANGYIAKVKVEPWGFGRVLYINHPNGNTTLYAHMNDFYPALEAYVKEQQYKLKSWAVFLDLPANLFPVKQGEQVGWSGNTGGSQGPHVHFEIRDTETDKVLNPLLMGFPISDDIAPAILRLAVYDRCLSTYEQTPKIYLLRKVNNIYVPVSGQVKVNTEKVSFAITAYDRYTGSTNQNGIYEAVVYDNNKAISGFRMDSISYAETRYLNAHIDYRYKAAGGSYLQHLSRLPGNDGGIYKTDASNGVVDFETEKEHAIRITVSDPNGNTSTLEFNITSIGNSKPAPNSAATGLPVFHPGFINVFENNEVQFYLNEKALYDSFHFKYNKTFDAAGRSIYQLHNSTVPIQNYFTLKIRSNIFITDTGRAVIFRSYGGKTDYVKAVYDNGWYKASFREFGNYQLLQDNTAPTISPLGFYSGIKAAKLTRIAFAVTDNTEEIKKFTALLDGKWLRFTNDKGRNFIYRFDELCGPGEHELVVTAEDQVGNVTTKTYNFTR
ncbi:MAG: M23 family metallopeptidase [Rhizobacter sp.]|nr:M23 family metallopeptidase [Ferruginibacter sp.]